MKIKLFQTPTAEKKGIWHILGREDNRSIHGICNGFGYWIEGYHNDKPEMKEPKRAIYDGTQKICSACIQQAYKNNIILTKHVK